MAKRLIWMGLLACAFVGCAKDTPRSGGRTASYWAEALKQSDVEQRRKAATKLGPLLLMDGAALPALVGAVKDTDPGVRIAAARSLGIYSGPKAPEALPVLREMQEHDPDVKVREAAASAIEMASR